MEQYKQEEDGSINIPEISISYAVTVKDELEEIQRLIPHLLKNKRPQDEIVVLWDNNGDQRVWEWLQSEPIGNIFLYQDKFNNHFADWKNKLFGLAKGDYLYFIDADEIPKEETFRNLHWIFKMNSEVDVFLVPRINIVKNLGLSWMKKWGWNCYKIEDQIQEKEFDFNNPVDKDEYDLLEYYRWIIEILEHPTINNQTIKIKFYTPRVNGFDWQWRICKNNGKIKWKNAVHEVLEGYDKYSFLPTDVGYDLLHVKTLEKQVKQNSFYENIH